MNPVQALKWTMTLLIPCGIYFLSPQEVSPHFPLYMGITSAAIIAWALNVFPAIGVAAMLGTGLTVVLAFLMPVLAFVELDLLCKQL